MFDKLHLLPQIWRKIILFGSLPHFSLLIWILPLLLFTSGHNSLMAHDIDDKIQVLLDFYIVIDDKPVNSISQVPAFSYAWIYKDQSAKLSRPHRIVGTVKEYQFIQVLR